jgi:RimJ/RimL family protein N-acetyltransferase
MLREEENRDAEAVTRLLLAADDSHVISAEGLRYRRHTQPERAQAVDLVADVDGEVVATGSARLDVWTTAEGVGWAFVTVGSAHRRQGLGDELGRRLLDHLGKIGARKARSFFRWTEEGERWAIARGWSRLDGGPLIALDPRVVPEPSDPAGYRCVAMAQVAPEAVYEALRETAVDEPGPVLHDAIGLDEFLRDWNEPENDLESGTVVLDAGGSVVAFTYLNVAGERAQHGFTATVREHRGRGLATAAKQRALRTAAAQGVTRVTTSNAEENAAMRAINRKLGFEPIGEHVIFGRDLYRYVAHPTPRVA